MRTVVLLLIFAPGLALPAGCGPSSATSSELRDIYVEDATGATADGNARRHKAKSDEILWTINMGGCTGSLLNKDYMLTANHCQPRVGARYSSGSALAKSGTQDITVASVAEANEGLDYNILKITWVGGTPPSDQLWPNTLATSQADVKMSTAANEGDEVFTIGFPGDKSSTWGATYAEGRLKDVQGSKVRYNIGSINGNSGGAVWRKSDKMLITMTNAGPNQLNQGSWNSGRADDASHWNHGAAMWQVYAQSTLLKEIFPGGKNATPHPALSPTPSTSGDEALFLAMEAQATSGNSVVFYLSTPAAAAAGFMCVGADSCGTAAPGVQSGARLSTLGDRVIFKFVQPQTLSEGLKISFAAADQSQAVLGQARTITLMKKTAGLAGMP